MSRNGGRTQSNLATRFSSPSPTALVAGTAAVGLAAMVFSRNLRGQITAPANRAHLHSQTNFSSREQGGKHAPLKGLDWFSELFGFAEASYAETKRWLQVVPCDESRVGQCLVSRVNWSEYGIGYFSTPRLDELRSRVNSKSLVGTLTVNNETGDVTEKIADPANLHATFQVASQFNCLEFVGPNVTPEDGITNYKEDRTQGPACSIACGPATVFRNYFARLPAEGNGLSEQFGQTHDRMIDNLSDVSALLGNENKQLYDTRGGYTMADSGQIKKLNKRLESFEEEKDKEKLRSALRVGVHEEVEVTATGWGQKILNRPSQTVTQVFGSACSVGYNRQSSPEQWQKFASIVLEASYDATLCAGLLAAQRHEGRDGSRRVFLTKLGGGVFGNPMEWIVAAMTRACERYKYYNLDVRIVTYAGEIDQLLQLLANNYPQHAGVHSAARAGGS